MASTPGIYLGEICLRSFSTVNVIATYLIKSTERERNNEYLLRQTN